MNMLVWAVLGFFALCSLLAAVSSDVGRQIQEAWASLWCPHRDASSEDDHRGDTCTSRVVSSTGNAISIGVSLAVVYAVSRMFKA